MSLKLVPPVHRATHRIGLHIERLEDPRVTQAEAHILAGLAGAGEATIGEIHRAFAHKRSTLTSILDRLEERQFVVRESDPRDRRTFVVRLTRDGKRAARRVVAHLERLEAAATRGVGREDVAAFLRVLDALESAGSDG